MSTPAVRLDAVIDELLAGSAPRGDTLSEIAMLAHAALRPMPPSVGFEARLRHRLQGHAPWRGFRPNRFIAAGAVSSAAVGVTALAVWRTPRRQPAGRLWHR
jgi:hypothetical protein